MLQEHHIWPKEAGGKKHPPTAVLRPPSVGREEGEYFGSSTGEVEVC